jgi:hypothetical protein
MVIARGFPKVSPSLIGVGPLPFSFA